MVSYRQLYLKMVEKLESAGLEDAGIEAAELLNYACKAKWLDSGGPSSEQLAALENAVDRRIRREPLQYIIGEWSFLDLTLKVGPGVLIPRPETEEVCLEAVEKIKEIARPRVLDLCSGSGAIALGIQNMVPEAEVLAVELEPAAYAYLEQNCKKFAAQAVKAPLAIQADGLEYHRQCPPDGLDLIVSNPPYVTRQEYESLSPELYHEPKSALVAEEEGLLFYRHFCQNYLPALKPGGWMVLEIGAAQAEAVAALLKDNGFTQVQVKKDMGEKDRIALGRRPIVSAQGL